MEDLKFSMELSYKEHPAFRFEQHEWSLAPELLNAFDRAVLAHRQCARCLDRTGEAALHSEAMAALGAIFEHLSQQADDEYEQLFLAELKQSVEGLLEQERQWFSKPSKNNGIRVAGEAPLENAIRMQVDRHFFGALPGSVVDELKRIGEPVLTNFRANAASGKLKRKDLSVNSGPVVRSMMRIINRAFRDQGVLDAVSAYAGRTMTVTGLSLELSLPQATWWRNAILGLPRSPDTLYAHLDESVVHPKSIIYLVDVTDKQGPTSCYPAAYDAMNLGVLQQLVGAVVGKVGGSDQSKLRPYYEKQYHQSANSENFRRHFMRLPTALRFNSHLGWDVLPDSVLEESLRKDEHAMVGPAGTFIVFDGARLLHRGGLMQEGERIALQIIFSDATLLDRVVRKGRRIYQSRVGRRPQVA